MEEVLERTRVGIAIKDFNPNSVTDGLHKLLALIADPDTSPRCMRAAEKYFSLNAGVVAYSKIYRELI
jgi:CRISPR/Cas system CSM-associated protein Csm2 small subunit